MKRASPEEFAHPKVFSADFVFGAPDFQNIPSTAPEVAVFGRSNVGKSTLINRITNRRDLARTSAQPGRTKEFNFFKLKIGTVRSPHEVTLVDLPGFGFARFSKEQRQDVAERTVNFIVERENLAVVCLLNDCRRLPEEQEIAVRNTAAENGRHVVIVATKVDKLGRNEREKAMKKLSSAYGLQREDIVESGDGNELENFWRRVLPLCF